MFGNSGIRIASILIGILFIVGLIFVANRFSNQIRNRFSQTEVANGQVSPTPAVQSQVSPTPQTGTSLGSTTTKGGINVNQIPNTGPDLIIVPVLVATLFAGLKLRKVA